MVVEITTVWLALTFAIARTYVTVVTAASRKRALHRATDSLLTQARFQGRQDRAFVHGPRLVVADRDEFSQCARHGLHGYNFICELRLLGNGDGAYIVAAGRLTFLKRQ